MPTKPAVPLWNSKNVVFPALHAGELAVKVPVAFHEKNVVVEPATNGLRLGGAVVRPAKDGSVILPIVNVLENEVRIPRGSALGFGFEEPDFRNFIGCTEDMSEREYEFIGQLLSTATDLREEAVREEAKRKFAGILPGEAKDAVRSTSQEGAVKTGRVKHGDVVTRTRIPGEVHTVEKAKGKRQGCKAFDLMEEIEFDQLDRAGLGRKVMSNAASSALIMAMIKKSECPDELQPRLRKILWAHKEVLCEVNTVVGRCPGYRPRIPLDTDEPIYTPQYPIPYRMREAMRSAVREFMDMGVVKPSSSPYNSPSLMVPKRDGGFRLVIDYRRLNRHVVNDPHPLPRIGQILETLGSAKWFTALDLLHGFYNLELNAADSEKTAFSTFDGHWEFNRLPMGLKNSPAIFQRLMQMILSGCLGKYAFIDIDDILIFSKTAEQHLDHLNDILARVTQAGLKIKASKSQLFRREVEYLGFLAGQEGVKVNPRKLDSISKFATPRKVRDVQAFLGIVGYFRIFIPAFAEKARPLYHLLKQDVPFQWTDATEKAFQTLKNHLEQAPVLAFPDFSLPFILTTNASSYAVGAILTQIQDGKERLVSCASRVLTDVETRYSNTDRETLAVVFGVTTFQSYLWGNKFTIHTDNTAIAAISRQTNSTNKRAMRWHVLLHEYDFEMKHRAACTMKHMDALSRYPVQDDHMATTQESIQYLSPSWQTDGFVPYLDLE